MGPTSSQGPLETGEEGSNQPGDDLTAEERHREKPHSCVWRLRERPRARNTGSLQMLEGAGEQRLPQGLLKGTQIGSLIAARWHPRQTSARQNYKIIKRWGLLRIKQVTNENSTLCSAVRQLSRVWPFCDPMDCSPPGSSVRGVLQARILEWEFYFQFFKRSPHCSP